MEPLLKCPGSWAALILCTVLARLTLATNDQSVVINEVCATPPSGSEKYVEIWNRGTTAVDTTNWYICDHPQIYYERLLQVPQDPGNPPQAPGIILQPGDFLLIKLHAQFPPPNGDYSTRPNNSGTTTHILRIFLPASAVARLIRCDPSASIGCHGNVAIWDQSPPGTPDNPSWNFAAALRDIVGWSENALYLPSYNGEATQGRRLCIASTADPVLWTMPVSGACPSDPTFAVIDSASFPQGSGLSINYNGRLTNYVTDYFIAPATEGEANIMPGDMNGDFIMNQSDYDAFVACLGQPATAPGCAPGDLDRSGTVDCADWPLFSADWQRYSPDPLPPEPQSCVSCTAGDINNDGIINGDDIAGFVAVATGGDTNPQHLCAADTDGNGTVDCKDLVRFVVMAMNGPGACVPGDVNGDGVANGDDIQPFIERILTAGPCTNVGDLCPADFSGDLRVTEDDIPGFVDALVLSP